MNPTIAMMIAQDHIAELRRDRQRAQLLTDRRRPRPALRVARLWPPARRVSNA